MALIKILQFPDPKLRRKGKPVTDFGEKTQKLIDDMFETHYNSENCAALAATQLDIPNAPHITVIDFSPEKNQPLCLVNAKIIERSGDATDDEGCMSVGAGGNAFTKLTRSAKIKVKGQDRHGKPIEFEALGFMAKCIQHELEHLDGKLFIDNLSSLKRKRMLETMNKQNRQQQKSSD